MSINTQASKFVDQAQDIALRWVDVASKNTQALFDLARASTQVRTLDEVKAFASEGAKVARENAERFTQAIQQTAQEQTAQWTETFQQAGQQAQAFAEGKTAKTKQR